MSTLTYWKDPTRDHDADRFHPAGIVELSDDDMQGPTGAAITSPACITATIALTASLCSPTGTLCGSCQMGTRGCC